MTVNIEGRTSTFLPPEPRLLLMRICILTDTQIFWSAPFSFFSFYNVTNRSWISVPRHLFSDKFSFFDTYTVSTKQLPIVLCPPAYRLRGGNFIVQHLATLSNFSCNFLHCHDVMPDVVPFFSFTLFNSSSIISIRSGFGSKEANLDQASLLFAYF